jgi:hypothetical protein
MDSSRVGNENADLIFVYAPKINLGYYPPFQVPAALPLPARVACEHNLRQSVFARLHPKIIPPTTTVRGS